MTVEYKWDLELVSIKPRQQVAVNRSPIWKRTLTEEVIHHMTFDRLADIKYLDVGVSQPTAVGAECAGHISMFPKDSVKPHATYQFERLVLVRKSQEKYGRKRWDYQNREYTQPVREKIVKAYVDGHGDLSYSFDRDRHGSVMVRHDGYRLSSTVQVPNKLRQEFENNSHARKYGDRFNQWLDVRRSVAEAKTGKGKCGNPSCVYRIPSDIARIGMLNVPKRKWFPTSRMNFCEDDDCPRSKDYHYHIHCTNCGDTRYIQNWGIKLCPDEEIN